MLRHDPILRSRTPIRRATCRSIRSSRCFSKSSPISARHNDEVDNNGGKKPEGMSDLEWMRQRHLRRWRKRIEEDPYRALFGASEDMLRGRGLEGYIQRQRDMHRKGMEWVEKTLPKWMLEDMGLRGRGEDKSAGAKEGKKGDEPQTKVKGETMKDSEKEEREGMFPQPSHRIPSYRSHRFEKDFWNDGVQSPSDSRRPRESPVNAFQNTSALREDIVQGLRKDKGILQEPQQAPSKATVTASKPCSNPTPERALLTRSNALLDKDATVRESTFIDEFLAVKTPTSSPSWSGRVHDKEWRQTALERRASQESVSKLRRKTHVPVVDVAAKYKALSGHNPEIQQDARPAAVTSAGKSERTTEKAVMDFQGTSGSRVGRSEIEAFASRVNETSDKAKMYDTIPSAQDPPKSRFSPYPRINTDEWVLPSRQETDKKTDSFLDNRADISSTRDLKFGQSDPETSANPRRSTSDVLKQLPEDDIDFLTADDVRASMGHMKGTSADKVAVRQKLEEDFKKDTPEIDSMLEARVMNDQYVRRKTSEITKAQEQVRSAEVDPNAVIPEQRTGDSHSKPVSVLETSLDFMSRWLHNGGNVLAQHFWQDPVQLVAGQLSGADEQFLKGIGIGVLKGRRAFASIKDELIDDIPVANELVDRLNRDEIKASAGAVRLYRDLPSALKNTSDTDASKAAAHKRIGKLRQALLDTDKQYKKACEAIDGMKNTSPSFLQVKRLRYASEVLRKNAKLTRMAVFGLQARIEVEAGSSSGLVARELLHRLLTLQDTQLALSRLVTRSMQVFGIDPEANKEVPTNRNGSTVDLSDPSVVEALASVVAQDNSRKQSIDTAAADQKLEVEVSKQKAAMRGLSDDGYRHTPKPLIRKSFEGPNPLAHSLFRPFGLQLDSLGKDADEKQEIQIDAAKKMKGDRELVKEVRKAYEDTYGAITLDHWQVPPTERPLPVLEQRMEVPETETAKPQPSIQMLKEDEVSPCFTGGASKSATESASAPQDDVATTKSAAEVETDLKNDRIDDPLIADDLHPLGSSDKPSGVPELCGTQEAAQVERRAPIAALDDTLSTSASSISTDNEYSYDSSIFEYVPITYKTLIYNAETDKFSITTSQVPQPNPPITPIPLHEALATLSHPSKFVDHLPESFHVLAVKSDVLSVRTASPSNATAEQNTITSGDKTNAGAKADAEEADGWKGINPVDGTTTLSPTGFVGVGSDLDRELDFAERRRKADEYHREVNKSRKLVKEPEQKGRKRVGVGGVLKTVIWAGAFCYIVGVAAEVAKTPF